MNALPSTLSEWMSRVGPGSGSPATLKARSRRPRRGQLTPAQQELAARFLPLARNLSKPLKLMYPVWRDEFESASCMALVEAAQAYDPRRNIRFATFARIRIRGALMDVGRSMVLTGLDHEDQPPGMVPLTPFNEEHGKVLVATAPPPVGSEVDDLDEIEHWLKKLPKRHAMVCRLYYLYGKSQMEIAHAFGCSQSEITRLHRKSIDLLSEPYLKRRNRSRDWDQSDLGRMLKLADFHREN